MILYTISIAIFQSFYSTGECMGGQTVQFWVAVFKEVSSKLWLDSIIQIELGIERPTIWLVKHIGITDWCRSQLRGLNSYHQHILSRDFICALGVHLCGNKVCAWLFPENTCFTKERFIFYIFKILLLLLLLFFFLAVLCSMQDTSSLTRGWTCDPAVEAESLNHWTAREVPRTSTV